MHYPRLIRQLKLGSWKTWNMLTLCQRKALSFCDQAWAITEGFSTYMKTTQVAKCQTYILASYLKEPKRFPQISNYPVDYKAASGTRAPSFQPYPPPTPPHTLGRFPNSRVTYPTQSPSVKCPGLLRGLWFLPQTCQSFSIISLQNCHLTGDISASLDRQHPCCFRRGEGWISHCPRS